MTLSSDHSDPEESDSSVMIGGISWMGIASSLTLILGLVMAMIATRVFTADVYGTFIILTLVASFLSLVTNLGLGTSVSRFLANSDNLLMKELLVNSVLTLQFIIFGLTILITYVLGPLLFKFLGAEWNVNAYYYVAILFFSTILTSILQSILQGFFLFRQIAIWNFSSSVLNLVFLLILILLSVDGLDALVFSRWLAYTLAAFYMFFSIPIKKRIVFRWDLIKDLIKFGFPLQLNGILDFFYSRIDTFLIATMLNTADIAYYEIASRIPDSLQSLFGSFNMAYFPSISRLYAKNDHHGAENLLENALRLTAFGSLFIAAIAYLFGKDIIRLLFSEQYLASEPVFIIISISLSVILIGTILGNSLVAVGESDKPVKINVVHSLVSLVLNLILIPYFGIVGAAFAGLFGPIITNPLNFIFLRRKLVVHAETYLKPIFIFIVWIGFSLLIPMENMLLKVGALIIFILINIFFSVIGKDDFLFLQSEVAKLMKTFSLRFASSKQK
jgi:O-antigen/teichoic acid export membrane protein